MNKIEQLQQLLDSKSNELQAIRQQLDDAILESKRNELLSQFQEGKAYIVNHNDKIGHTILFYFFEKLNDKEIVILETSIHGDELPKAANLEGKYAIASLRSKMTIYSFKEIDMETYLKAIDHTIAVCEQYQKSFNKLLNIIQHES